MSLTRIHLKRDHVRRAAFIICAGLATVVVVIAAGHCRAQETLPVKERIARETTRTSKPAPLNTPAGVSFNDGLTEDEAVALALWNNPVFNNDLSTLGFARADLREAGLLRNPVMSLLFPLGPKQFEATINFPFEVLWQRPRRVAAAKANLERVAKSLEQNALNLVRDVRLAYADVRVAQERARLAGEALNLRRQIPVIMDARLRAGDISEQEAVSARADARTAEEEAARLAREVGVVKERLRFLLGLSVEPTRVELTPTSPEPDAPAEADELLRAAYASRPDLRAAELSIETAAKRAKWERSKIFTLMTTLDMNGSGKRGFEAGPGLVAEIPIFNRNQGGISRAEAEVEAAARQYALTRQRIASEVNEARQQLVQARESLAEWRGRVLPALKRDTQIQEASFRDGEIPYLFVLQHRKRLDDARVREAELGDQARRARIQLDRAVGRSSYNADVKH